MRIVLALLLAAGCVTTGDRSPEREQAIDALMHDFEGGVPGASVAVIHEGNVVFRKSYGLANLENRAEAASTTNYRLASVTKQFTATAILLLAEEGRLSIDDSITRFLSDLPDYARDATVRHLLSHTSGLPDYENLIPDAQVVQLTDRDVLRLVAAEDSPIFAAGSKYQYSNTGYALLALIVEEVSGERFPAFLRDRIFAPLGMSDTVAHVEGVSIVAHRAIGYSPDGSGFVQTDQSLTSAVLGDGGIYSSIDDLSRWDRAIVEQRILSASSWRLARMPFVTTDRPEVFYGFGWRIGEYRERQWIGHAGETSGFRNAMLRFPREDLAVIVLTNRNEGSPWKIALAIADLYF